jgi:hypothetical protein
MFRTFQTRERLIEKGFRFSGSTGDLRRGRGPAKRFGSLDSHRKVRVPAPEALLFCGPRIPAGVLDGTPEVQLAERRVLCHPGVFGQVRSPGVGGVLCHRCRMS